MFITCVAAAISMSTGCEPHQKKTTTVEVGKAQTNEYIIEGCYYIGRLDSDWDSRGHFLTHKGNCPNPIHKEAKVEPAIATQRDKMLEEAKDMTSQELIERAKADTNFAKIILDR
jgi:hypothetical protein